MKKTVLQLLSVSAIWMIMLGLFSCAGNAKQEQQTNLKPYSEVVTPVWAKNAVIYEVNIRQYTPEGSFDAFARHLPRLKELGVDILWLMPIHPIGQLNRKGSLGSYYSVQDYKAINPEFGSIDDFKSLVNQAHESGFKVIIDWVANHTAFDHEWTQQHPEWYYKDEHGKLVSPYDWTDVAHLDYEQHPDLWDAMIDAMKYWVIETNIDGYRCDVAGMVPTAFWERARLELDAIKPVFMLAEDEAQRNLTQKAFDANYGWEFHHLMNRMAKGEKNPSDVWDYFARQDTLFAPSIYRMMFTSNHDENSWNGTVFERLGQGAPAFAVMSYTVPGFPLIYNGQEVALNHRLQFFEKDEINWDTATIYTDFYTKLNQIKKSNESLWNADSGGAMIAVETDKPEAVLSFIRQKNDNEVLVFINCTAIEQDVQVKDEHLYKSYIDLFTNDTTHLQAAPFKMGAWSFKLLK